MTQGRFITVEGGEGAGKSTQVRLLCDALRARGIDAIVTREPGGSPGAEEIRRLLVEGEVNRWDAMTELLLHFAARRDHLVRTVWPAIALGRWVISDRFADSTAAYQGDGLGLGHDAVAQLYSLVIGDFRPDVTIVLDVSEEVGLERTKNRGGAEDRYERMGSAFHAKLRQAFLNIAANNPQRCTVVPATGSIQEINQAMLTAVMQGIGPMSASDGT